MRRRLVEAEALVWLVLASLLIRLLPFRRLAVLTGGRRRAPAASEGEARAVGRTVERVAARLPWRSLCFEQGIAAQLMLRRRGRGATLHYGARHDESGRLVAHVWVRSGVAAVTGCDGAERYALLARFPAAEG